MVAILYLTTTLAGNADEQSASAVMSSTLGHTVTQRAANDADKTTTGFDVLVISANVTVSQLASTAYLTTTTGAVIFLNSAWGTSYYKMIDAANGVSQTDLGVFYIHDHPISTLAGLSPGDTSAGFTATATGRSVRTSQFPAGTEHSFVAQQNNSSDIDYLVFAYDTGDLLTDLTTTAHGRRVGFGANSNALALMDAESLDLLDASIRWASGEDPAGGTDFTGSVALTGSGTLALTGTPGAAASGTLSGSGTLALTGEPAMQATVALSGSGTLTLTGDATQNVAADATLSGSGTLALTGEPAVRGTRAATGTGTLTLAGAGAWGAQVALSGSGGLSLGGAPAFTKTLDLTGGGTLVTVATAIEFITVLDLTGTGTLTMRGSVDGASMTEFSAGLPTGHAFAAGHPTGSTFDLEGPVGHEMKVGSPS